MTVNTVVKYCHMISLEMSMMNASSVISEKIISE